MEDVPDGKVTVVVAAVVEHSGSGEILILKKAESSPYLPGNWEVCSGRLTQLENPETGLRREVKEEAGLDIEIIQPLRTFHFFIGEKKPENEFVGITFWCRSNSRKVRISEEHSDFKWVKAEEAGEFVNMEGILNDIASFMKARAKVI